MRKEYNPTKTILYVFLSKNYYFCHFKLYYKFIENKQLSVTLNKT
jgi:hypothetical protein